jgi:hypothetical protein
MRQPHRGPRPCIRGKQAVRERVEREIRPERKRRARAVRAPPKQVALKRSAVWVVRRRAPDQTARRRRTASKAWGRAGPECARLERHSAAALANACTRAVPRARDLYAEPKAKARMRAEARLVWRAVAVGSWVSGTRVRPAYSNAATMPCPRTVNWASVLALAVSWARQAGSSATSCLGNALSANPLPRCCSRSIRYCRPAEAEC